MKRTLPILLFVCFINKLCLGQEKTNELIQNKFHFISEPYSVVVDTFYFYFGFIKATFSKKGVLKEMQVSDNGPQWLHESIQRQFFIKGHSAIDSMAKKEKVKGIILFPFYFANSSFQYTRIRYPNWVDNNMFMFKGEYIRKNFVLGPIIGLRNVSFIDH